MRLVSYLYKLQQKTICITKDRIQTLPRESYSPQLSQALGQKDRKHCHISRLFSFVWEVYFICMLPTCVILSNELSKHFCLLAFDTLNIRRYKTNVSMRFIVSCYNQVIVVVSCSSEKQPKRLPSTLYSASSANVAHHTKLS